MPRLNWVDENAGAILLAVLAGLAVASLAITIVVLWIGG